MAGIRPSTEPYASLLARTMRDRFAAQWGLAETGAAGPSGNGYGDPPGHSCIALSGTVERATTIETGSADRLANMRSFASSLLQIFLEVLEADGARAVSR
jgi:nicotinamide mononucleotide (NMN) deamidase PncC